MDSLRVIRERYEVLETLALDSGREELRARDRMLGREVLIVRRMLETGPRQDRSERALREARALAALRHPGVQRLLDAFDDDGCATLVLEPATGEALAARLEREGRLASDEVLRIAIAVAEALAAVHAAGAVHRDVSEENVVLGSDGSICTTGFRLAKPIAPSEATSLEYGPSAGDRPRPLDRQGLPAHPAPEQLGGEAASPRSDLFALGCVLYRALTGRAAMPEILERGFAAPPAIESLAPDTPRAFAQLVTLCIARSPIGRPRSAAELAGALHALQSGPASARARSRRPILVGSATIALVAVAFSAWRLDAEAGDAAASRGLGLRESDAPARLASTTFAAGFRSSRALLIGIGEAYRKNGFDPLANAVRDVRAVDAALRGLARDRWETRLLCDEEATFDGIRTALAELEAGLEAEDRVLVYFAGHGVPHERSGSSGWIVPADGASLAVDPARTRWLHFDAFDRFLGDVPAKHVLLAMDCCYGGRIASMRSSAALDYEERFLSSPARVVLAAGRADEQVSDGGANGHSPFAEAFLGSLSGQGVAITSSMLHADMLRAFADRRLPQTPVLAYPVGAPPGEFVFFLE